MISSKKLKSYKNCVELIKISGGFQVCLNYLTIDDLKLEIYLGDCLKAYETENKTKYVNSYKTICEVPYLFTFTSEGYARELYASVVNIVDEKLQKID
ncbi:MAG: hypothetical protein Terrestrivirus1_280 [Terrestrivirus sp.]|uniref:Uncharacterized protein n=1 Tax=Terrestrivirus sp. TaxID=2487775 RepID=A0A3G4ZKN4_9VIRU|nr:MAG: hypothetical protein Terrestrivirus1_280 [Terrestrivirus sp.]